jgi:hypothetical protein
MISQFSAFGKRFLPELSPGLRSLNPLGLTEIDLPAKLPFWLSHFNMGPRTVAIHFM